MKERARSVATGALLALLTAVVWWVSPNPQGLAPALRHPQAYVDRVGADQAAIAAVCLLCWVVLAWLAAGLALTAASALPGALGRSSGALAGWILPATFRRTAALALGLSLATGGGAAGAMIASHSEAPAPPAATRSLDWPVASEVAAHPATSDLDWPARQEAPPAPTRQADPQPRKEIVVLRGDSLWSIARRALGPGADDAAVAREWPRWYAANRRLIGPNPDLILPGQRLVAPPAA
ncbi:MAG TPA: LysM domain-containing protein [Mycobacteriales bacterium]|nr:LysM domain-containing protein [Mycobacteriales bacterium]